MKDICIDYCESTDCTDCEYKNVSKEERDEAYYKVTEDLKMYGYYKCRLCNKEFYNIFIPDKDIPYAFAHMTSEIKIPNYPLLPDRYEMHCCENGNYGLADFIGFRKDEEKVLERLNWEDKMNDTLKATKINKEE